MLSPLPAPAASPRWIRSIAILGPVGVPLLIAFECSLQSMILFEGLFLGAFLLGAALALGPFLRSRLHWPEDRTESWSKASVWGTVAAALLTLLFALQVSATTPPPDVGTASTAEYLTVAILFPLVLGTFQAVAVRTQLRLPALWPVAPALGSALSYGASQVIELLEAYDKTGTLTLALTLAVAFLITYWIQRAGLVLLKPASARSGADESPGRGPVSTV